MNTTPDPGNQPAGNIPAPPAVPPKQPAPPQSDLSWVEKNQGLAVGSAFILILFYMMPIFIILAAAYTTTWFQQSSFLLVWFAAFMKSAESTLGEFHKVLFPIISALSVIVFRTRPTKAMLCLGGFIFLSFIITIFISVAFDMSDIKTALAGLKDPINMDLARAFFTRVQETLLMYFMMLVGISVANASK